MADHVAEQIIAAAKTALTGLTTTGANVFDSRVYPLQESELPGLKVDQGDEDISGETIHSPSVLERDMELVVVACVKRNTAYRTQVNTIRKEVEIALAVNPTLGGLCHFIEPRSCAIDLDGGAEHPCVEATMTFGVRYYTSSSAPDVPL